jgi:predicted RNase H-like HicB family nuclease
VLYDQQRVRVVLQNGRKLEDDSYMATVEGLRGVIAVGDTIEECKDDLIGFIEGWVALGLRLGHTIPTIDGHTINVSLEPVPVVE